MPMPALIVFDSWFGNCRRVAEHIRRGFESTGRQIETTSAKEVGKLDLSSYTDIVIGSPTHGGSPTGRIKKVLKRLPEAGTRKNVFLFTTRGDEKGEQDALIWMRKTAQEKGYILMSEERFFVGGVRGPVKPSELEKAEQYGKEISSEN